MTTKEAIEILREAHDNALFSVRTALETLIPELVDSKDEIIRKELLALVRMNVLPEATCLVRGGSVTRAQAEAYLEKQKESQELPLMNGDADLYFDTWRQEVPVPTFRQCFEEGMRYVQRLQKEQKPAHTAKEMWKEMRLEVYAQASGNRHEPNYSDDSTKMFSLCDIDEIFEKIGNSTVEPQPAEWSKEDEETLRQIIEETLSDEVPNGSGGTMSWAVALSGDDIKKLAPKVLALAKKELLKDDELTKKHLEGYCMGREDTLREMMDFVESHFHGKKTKEFDTPTINIPAWEPTCYHGGPCTNPMRDCINCPGTTAGGGFSTSSGTSEAILHGNTSVTDGEPHNPSFTD